jgi:hypothetical protein
MTGDMLEVFMLIAAGGTVLLAVWWIVMLVVQGWQDRKRHR